MEEELEDPEIKPHGFWKETKNLTKLCRLLEQKFSILSHNACQYPLIYADIGTNLEQWYSVSINDIKDEGYRYKHVIMSCGGLAGFLKRVYPGNFWLLLNFIRKLTSTHRPQMDTVEISCCETGLLERRRKFTRICKRYRERAQYQLRICVSCL